MTDVHDRLVELARIATDDDDIVAAGDFLPKGTTWKSGGFGGQYIGRGMGMVAAPIISDTDEDALAIVGLTGTTRTLADKQGNPVIVLAASPTTLHLLVTESAMHGPTRTKALTAVGQLDRAGLDVHVGQRLSVRTL
ncbi:hypothetical protein [Ilumatobacter sp.]|uniref:hypothetical protein n=1 Tax=Ilumatobacter sp. TaxID=1967498 RepID=UPI003C690E8D